MSSESILNWENKRLDEVVDILDSRRVPINAKERSTREGNIPYFGATGQVGWIDDYLFDEEIILLGEDGAPFLDSSKQKAYVVRGKSWVNNHAHVLRAKPGVPALYLKYWLDRLDYHPYVNGTTRLKLTQGEMRNIPVAMAPERKRYEIVAEIEKQFSRLDEAVANLKRVKANLKRYKVAVLKAAVEGRLVPTDGNWKTLALGDIALSIRNGYSSKPDAESGTPILRISAVRPMALDVADVRYLSGALKEYESFLISPGDVLFTRYNGNRDYVGVCACVPPGIEPTVYPDKLIRVRVPVSTLLPEFLVIAASAGSARAFLKSKIRTTAGQSGISGGDLKALPLTLPCVAEQHRIVDEVELHLSLVRGVETQIDANLKRADVMRRSVLARVFRNDSAAAANVSLANNVAPFEETV